MDGVNVGLNLPHPLLLQGGGGVAPKNCLQQTTYMIFCNNLHFASAKNICQKGWSVNHAGWLAQKNLKKFADLTTRVNLVPNLLTTKELPVSVGAKLLDINRTSIYYKGTPVSEAELACKEIIDHLHTDNSAWGARQMSAQPKARGYHVGRRKTRRYMNETC